LVVIVGVIEIVTVGVASGGGERGTMRETGVAIYRSSPPRSSRELDFRDGNSESRHPLRVLQGSEFVGVNAVKRENAGRR